jgi:hypothetical protein
LSWENASSRRLIGCAVTLDVAVALGAPLRGGPLAVLAIAGLLAGWTLGYAGLSYVVGLRARSPEALTALVPLFLPISLLSTAYGPPSCCPAGSAPPPPSTPTATWSTLCGSPGNEGRWTTWARWPETTSGGRISSSTARGERPRPVI